MQPEYTSDTAWENPLQDAGATRWDFRRAQNRVVSGWSIVGVLALATAGILVMIAG